MLSQKRAQQGIVTNLCRGSSGNEAGELSEEEEENTHRDEKDQNEQFISVQNLHLMK